jgi:hypothetical protein
LANKKGLALEAPNPSKNHTKSNLSNLQVLPEPNRNWEVFRMSKPRTFTVLNTVSHTCFHTTVATRSQLSKRLEVLFAELEPHIRLHLEGSRQIAAHLWAGDLLFMPHLAWVLVEGDRKAVPLLSASSSASAS